MRGDFVIQVKTDADSNNESFHGRVEHMDSGVSARFRSAGELVSFIRETIHRDAIQPDAAAAPGSVHHLSPKDLTKS